MQGLTCSILRIPLDEVTSTQFDYNDVPGYHSGKLKNLDILNVGKNGKDNVNRRRNNNNITITSNNNNNKSVCNNNNYTLTTITTKTTNLNGNYFDKLAVAVTSSYCIQS